MAGPPAPARFEGPSEFLRGDARRRADQPAVLDDSVDRVLRESGVAHT
jgi:hypothetical protein